MKGLILMIGISVFSVSGYGAERDPWFVTPFAAVGVNSQQGTGFILGLDLGLRMDEHWRVGVTGHYAAGNSPANDREYGAGAFASYAYRLGEMFVAHARQELGYLDVRNPIDPEPLVGPTYEAEDGLASTTTLGFTTYFTDNLALSVGYRFVVGLTNSDLGDGRSGPTFGVILGF